MNRVAEDVHGTSSESQGVGMPGGETKRSGFESNRTAAVWNGTALDQLGHARD